MYQNRFQRKLTIFCIVRTANICLCRRNAFRWMVKLVNIKYNFMKTESPFIIWCHSLPTHAERKDNNLSFWAQIGLVNHHVRSYQQNLMLYIGCHCNRVPIVSDMIANSANFHCKYVFSIGLNENTIVNTSDYNKVILVWLAGQLGLHNSSHAAPAPYCSWL